MATLTKAQIKEIIRKAPAGTTPEGVVQALRAKGHQLEGYPNPQQESQIMQNASTAETRKGVIEKAGDFLGITKFGKGIGVAASNITGGLKPLEDAQKSLLAQSDTLMTQYKAARAKGDKASATKILGLMQQNADALKVIADQFTDVGTDNISNKEFLGSAAMTLGNIALAGAGSQGAAVRGSVGGSITAPTLLKAGTKVASAVPAITSPLVRNAGVSAYLKSLGVNVARSGAVGAGFGAASGAEQNKDATGIMQQAAIGLLIGGALPVAGEAVRGIVKGVGKGAQYLAQTFSGVPQKAIEYARANPEGVRAGIRRAVSDEKTVFNVANTANKAAGAIEAKRNSAFQAGLKKLETQLKGQPIDPTPFNESLKKSLQRFDVIDAKGKLNPESVISDPRELSAIKQILDRMKAQKNLTPEGWWKLKRFVDNKYAPTASGEYQSLIMDISSGLRDEMTKNVKGFDKLLSGYEAESTLLAFLKKELGVSGRARGLAIGEDGGVVIQENTKRVINALKRTMQDNQPLAAELLKEMERVGGKSINDDLVGMYFAEWLPPKLQSILGLGAGSVLGITAGVGTAAKALPLAAFASPRLVGEGSALVGQVTRGLRNVNPQLVESLKNAGRGTVYNAQ